MWSGIILANTVKAGRDAKSMLGLKYWHILTPKLLADGMSGRGMACDPRLITVEDSCYAPLSETIMRYPLQIATICGGRKPEVWYLRKSE